MSIKDFSDATLVNLCVQGGCEYVVNAVANITSSSRTLELDFVYLGEPHLNQ